MSGSLRFIRGAKHGEHRQAPSEDNGGAAAGDTGGAGAFVPGPPAPGTVVTTNFTPTWITSSGVNTPSPLAGQGGLAAPAPAWWATISPPNPPSAPPKLENGGIRVGEIIAWRWWWPDASGHLRSCVIHALWPMTEPLRATMCGSVDPTPAEPNGMTYGIYAFKTEQDAINDRVGPILGRVMLWGTVVEYERGYTAEYARVVSLDLVWEIFAGHERNLLHDLRQRYGLPLDGGMWQPPLRSEE